MTTWHYEHDTRPKRGYLNEAMYRPIIAAPLRTEVQADGETIHTAFIEVQWASRKFDVERMRDALERDPADCSA